jgi:hypothetical protein
MSIRLAHTNPAATTSTSRPTGANLREVGRSLSLEVGTRGAELGAMEARLLHPRREFSQAGRGFQSRGVLTPCPCLLRWRQPVAPAVAQGEAMRQSRGMSWGELETKLASL